MQEPGVTLGGVPRRAVLEAAPLGICALLLPTAARAASPDGGDPPESRFSIAGTSGSDGAVTIFWEDDP